MKLVSTPGNPVPDGAVAGKVRTPDGVELRSRAGIRRPMARERSASSTGAASSSKNISRRCASCGSAALRSRRWIGGGRGTRRGNCRIRARGMSKISRNSRSTSRRSCSAWCCPIVRRPILRWLTRWAARSLLRSAHSGKRWFEHTVMVAPMIDFPRLRASLPLRLLMRALRLAGLGASFVPGSNADRARASGFPGNPLTSDPVRYARNAAISDRIQRLQLVLRRWHGWMRRSIR